ncbi:hypothetical protein M569_01465 [Genlisea aurea]|uniref:Uncharacterized protein n=1 Tax=Genlisea aurea TaxID=192259 RepID=S8D0H8_9LAMI|nr:hypothetical protein M569_01465 [Genlisea aurea]
MRAAEFWSIRGSSQQQPSTSNGKNNSMLSETLIRRCGSVVGNAPFPRKQRSAMKTRAKYGGVQLNRKDGRKKLKKHEVIISKDEEEVAEALFALANMFTDVTNNDDDRVPSDDGNGSKIAVEVNESDIVDPQRRDHPAHEVVHHGSTSDSRRNAATSLGVKKSNGVVEAVSHEQNGGVAKSSSTNGDLKSEATNQSLLRLSSLPNDSDYMSPPTKFLQRNDASKKSLNRCANHVSISRMIKVLKLTGKEEEEEEDHSKIDLNAAAGLKDSTETTKMDAFLQKNMLVKDHHLRPHQGCDFIINDGGGVGGELRKKGFQIQNRFCFPFSSPSESSGSVLLHQYVVDPPPHMNGGEWSRAHQHQQQQMMWAPQVRDLTQQCCVFPSRNGRRRPHP